MDDEFAGFAARLADECARNSMELAVANRLLCEALDSTDFQVPARWRQQAEKHLRGHG